MKKKGPGTTRGETKTTVVAKKATPKTAAKPAAKAAPKKGK